ncbi:hypothetical protein ID866_4527, partial [Astraeus odoratus]
NALVNGNWSRFDLDTVKMLMNMFHAVTALTDGPIRYLIASGASTAFGPPPGITFDRFVRACVTVKTLTEAFQQ